MTSPTLHIGPRVKYARGMRNMTQDALATALGFNDRQSVSDIENGKRPVRAEELLKLSDALDQDVEFFLDPFNVVAEASYSWRAADNLPGPELDQFQSVANGWVGMARWLHQQEPGLAPAYDFVGLRINEKSTFEQAISSGERLAQMLMLGAVPALSLPECLDKKLGIPVLFIDTAAELPKHAISGAACQLDGFGVILVNRHESAYRRNFDLAHELFHLLTWESMTPGHRESNATDARTKHARVEQLANNFASALLMPSASLDQLIDPAKTMDAQHLADIAEHLQVTTDALGWRLFNMKRVDQTTREKLAGLRRPDSQATPKPFSPGFVQKLHTALDKGRLSARKAAKAMGMSLFGLASLFEVHDMPAPFEL